MCHEHHFGREGGQHGEGPRHGRGDCCHDHERHDGRRDECCCEDNGAFGLKRHFVSKAEMIEALEDYLDELEKEAQGVREAIAELKAEQPESPK